YRPILPWIEQQTAANVTYAEAPPIKTFICPSRRGTTRPWSDYASGFSPLQQIPSPPPASDPELVALSQATSILDPGSTQGLSLAKITSADGASHTLLFAHKFVQPKNYNQINQPPYSPYDNNTTVDPGCPAPERAPHFP